MIKIRFRGYVAKFDFDEELGISRWSSKKKGIADVLNNLMPDFDKADFLRVGPNKTRGLDAVALETLLATEAEDTTLIENKPPKLPGNPPEGTLY
jgi:hypothetical protein